MLISLVQCTLCPWGKIHCTMRHLCPVPTYINRFFHSEDGVGCWQVVGNRIILFCFAGTPYSTKGLINENKS